MHIINQPWVLPGVPSVHIKMAALSLTEEMFAVIQGPNYIESVKHISPGSGLHEGMFNSLEQSQYYELDTRLTFKGYRHKKGARRKTMTNPTMMYMMFSVFAKDSPQQVRRSMVQWINDNKRKFETQTMLAFTAKDIELDTWLLSIDSNGTPGDEFALFALCQMYTWHALIVTSSSIWTTVHPKHELNDHDLRRKCDLHLIYLGGDAFGILKPKFEWKVDVPLEHIEMVEPPDKPLQDSASETLSKEASVSNISDVKDEPLETSTLTELQDVTNQTQNVELPYATSNLIVALPPDMQLNLDSKTSSNTPPKVSGTKPCSVKLYRCDIVTPDPKPTPPLEVNVVVKHSTYDLRDHTRSNKATSTSRSCQSISANISYVGMFQDSSSEDTSNESQVQSVCALVKREPSHYRLAAHKYMLAKRRGIILGPTLCTLASTLPKMDNPKEESTDSDTTVIIEGCNKSKSPNKTKTTRCNTKSTKTTKQKTFVTKSYILRKGSSKAKPKFKKRKPYLFKCLMCELKWPTCKERNDHFKKKHRKLQCKKCKRFFRTPSAFTLHKYIHMDSLSVMYAKSSFPLEANWTTTWYLIAKPGNISARNCSADMNSHTRVTL